MIRLELYKQRDRSTKEDLEDKKNTELVLNF